jgi:hypothetical protein
VRVCHYFALTLEHIVGLLFSFLIIALVAASFGHSTAQDQIERVIGHEGRAAALNKMWDVKPQTGAVQEILFILNGPIRAKKMCRRPIWQTLTE